MLANKLTSNLFKVSTRIMAARTQSTAQAAETNAAPNIPNYKDLAVSCPKPFVFHVEFNRPDKLNSLTHNMWLEIYDCFTNLDVNEDCRVVMLSAKGRAFTAGLDFTNMMSVSERLADAEDVARKCKIIKEKLSKYQEVVSSLEKCSKPVLSLIQGPCVGAGVNLITAADIRYCTKDAMFQLKEVDIGMAADVGALQRLPRVVSNASICNEFALTARKMLADEAMSIGLVSKVFDTKESMYSSALEVAETIALKSPVAVQVTKRSIVYSRDHTVQDGLEHISILNQTMLQCEDFVNATVASATKSPPPVFAKL